MESETCQRLKGVEALRIGQTEAPETEPLRALAIEVVRETVKVANARSAIADARARDSLNTVRLSDVHRAIVPSNPLSTIGD